MVRAFSLALALVLTLAHGAFAAAPQILPTHEQTAEFERASEPQRVKLLIYLSRNGQHDLAASLLAQYPLSGEYAANRTLFIEGLILKARGNLTGAVKKFRAALADDPKLTLVRAELARTLVMLDENDSAKHHLDLLVADAPTEQEAAGIRAFIDQIDERRPYRVNAYVSLAPTTNVNNGSGHKTVYSPVFGSDLTISEDSQQKSGLGVATGVNAAYMKRLGNDFSFVAAGSAEARLYDDAEFNAFSFSQSVEVRYLLDRGYLGIGAVASQSLENDSIDIGYVSYGPRLSARYNLTQRDLVTASTVYEWRNYADSTIQDGTAWMTDLAWTHAFNSSFNATLSGGYDDVRLDMEAISYDTWSVGVNLYKEMPLGITISLNGEARFSEFDAVNVLAGVIREDTRLIGGMTLTKRDFNIFGFAPSLDYTYVNNASNIAIYDYDSHAVDFRLTKDF